MPTYSASVSRYLFLHINGYTIARQINYILLLSAKS